MKRLCVPSPSTRRWRVGRWRLAALCAIAAGLSLSTLAATPAEARGPKGFAPSQDAGTRAVDVLPTPPKPSEVDLLDPTARLAHKYLPAITDRSSLPNPFRGPERGSTIAAAGGFIGTFLVLTLLCWFAVRRTRPRDGDPGRPPRPPPAAEARPLELLLLFTSALALRVIGLGAEAADSQEVTYWMQVVVPRQQSGGSIDGFFMATLAPQIISPHPPFYRMLLYLWSGWGDSLAWLRAPSAICGAWVTIYVTRFGVAGLGRRWGLLAGALYVVSPFSIYYAQTVTPYMLTSLVCIGTLWTHHRALEPGGPFKRYAALMALSFITHFSAPALLAPLGLEVLVRFFRSDRSRAEWHRLWRFFLAVAIAFVPFSFASISLFFFAQLVPYLLPYVHDMRIFAPPGASVGESLARFFDGYAWFVWHGLVSSLGHWGAPLVAIPALVTTAFGLMRAGDAGSRWMWTVRVPAVSFLVFFVLLGVGTSFGNGFFYFASRRFTPLTPLLVLLFVAGVRQAWARLSASRLPAVAPRVLAAGLVLSSFVPQVVAHATQATRLDKPDMRVAVEWLDTHLQDGDGVAVGPYTFFDFMVGFHARDHYDDWFYAGGPARWIQWERPTDRRGERDERDVMVSLNDVLLLWPQVLQHARLERVLFVGIDEQPYGLNELEGGGTIHAFLFEKAGFTPCADVPEPDLPFLELRCFQRLAPPAPLDRLVVDGDFYRQAAGVVPPGQVQSLARRLSPSTALVFGGAREIRAVQVKVDNRLKSEGRDRAKLDDTRLAVEVLAGRKPLAPGAPAPPGKEAYAFRETHLVELPRGESRHRIPVYVPPEIDGSQLLIKLRPIGRAVRDTPRCFGYRREWYPADPTSCGIFLQEASVTRVALERGPAR